MSKIRCNNCMNVFDESNIICDEDKNEHCPFCGKGGCLMDLECEIDTGNKFLEIVNEISKAIEDGYLQKDPNNKDNILVYRLAGKTDPEGWYSENILSVASELANNENDYISFKEVIENARKERKNNMSRELQGYKRYQLEWMIDHGYSLEDLMNKIAEIINEELTIDVNAHVFIDEAFDILENEIGFEGSEIWVCEDEWKENERELYIEELLKKGIEQNIVKIIESPNDRCVACQIGEYWFYFIGSEDECMTPEQIKESYTCDELVELICGAIVELDDTEINYYISYIKEHLNN